MLADRQSSFTRIAGQQKKDYPVQPAPFTTARITDEFWSNLGRRHELYNMGLLYGAAVAHYQATGKAGFGNVHLQLAH